MLFPRLRTDSNSPRRRGGRTAKRRLHFEALENRRLLAINLIYGGTGNPVNLFDLDGSTDNVTLSQPTANSLKIDLNGAHFGDISDPEATGLIYQVPGQPTSSTWATIDLTPAGAVPNVSLNTDGGDDRIQLAALSSTHITNLQIDGQGGTDTITLYGDPVVTGYVNLEAESIVHLPLPHDPTDLTLSNAIVDILSGSGTKVGNLLTTDPDAGDSFTYALVPGVGATQNDWFQVLGDQLQVSGAFAPGALTTCSVRIRTTDATGLSLEKPLTISILSTPWHNSTLPQDVDGLSGVTPLDVLLIINYVNTHPGSVLPRPHPSPGSSPYYDVNNDGYATPLDVLQTINYINNQGRSGGEAESASAAVSPIRLRPAGVGHAVLPQGTSEADAMAIDAAFATAMDADWGHAVRLTDGNSVPPPDGTDTLSALRPLAGEVAA